MEEKKSIGLLVKQINNIYEKDFNNRLRRLGITASQCAVLNYLFHSPKEQVTQRDIEKNLSLKNPTVTGLLKRLEDKGFIFSVPGTKDRRCKNIYLSEKAFDIQKKMEAERRKLDGQLVLGMQRKERDALLRALGKVLYNIEEP